MNGWTVVASSANTTFTNDATGHGMIASLNDVQSF
jgi:hypothetical protein